jgi:hypothetical protein
MHTRHAIALAAVTPLFGASLALGFATSPAVHAQPAPASSQHCAGSDADGDCTYCPYDGVWSRTWHDCPALPNALDPDEAVYARGYVN